MQLCWKGLMLQESASIRFQRLSEGQPHLSSTGRTHFSSSITTALAFFVSKGQTTCDATGGGKTGTSSMFVRASPPPPTFGGLKQPEEEHLQSGKQCKGAELNHWTVVVLWQSALMWIQIHSDAETHLCDFSVVVSIASLGEIGWPVCVTLCSANLCVAVFHTEKVVDLLISRHNGLPWDFVNLEVFFFFCRHEKEDCWLRWTDFSCIPRIWVTNYSHLLEE